jgi:hypothetical protein
VLSLVMAYRLLREFRQAFTRLDTPPFSIRHHPGSVIARSAQHGDLVPNVANPGIFLGHCRCSFLSDGLRLTPITVD